MTDTLCTGLLEMDGHRGGQIRQLSVELEKNPDIQDPRANANMMAYQILTLILV